MTDRRDDDVARVLAGMREAEPAPGMKARVLARMAAEQADAAFDRGKRPGAGWDAARTLIFRAWSDLAGVVRGTIPNDGAFGEWAVLGRAVAVSAMVAVVMMGGVVGFRRLVAVQDVHSMRKVAGRTASPLSAGVVAEVPVRGAGRPGISDSGTVHGWNRRVQTADIVTVSHVAARPQKPGDAAEVSFPAPPMPLTRQERLLLRMLRGGGATELVATLSPEAREAMQRNEGIRRQEFFALNRPEIEAEKKAVGIKDAGTPVDGVGHMGPALKMSTDQDANATGSVREKE